ncbi:MAG: sulfotransferase [Xanthobacteraceae bacterium]|nr:sulfotransferase [Xanthobacteraceae bacterium]
MTRERLLGSQLAERVAALPPPVVIFNKSHSGSRLIARLAQDQGIFMGAALNESLDALPFLPLVEHVVLEHYPAFELLRRTQEWPPRVRALVDTALDAHLAGHRPGQPWGWKLCETVYILPLIATIFPKARFVHLVRDGRDVAFSDHVSPELPFWRKVYFGNDAVVSWRGMPLDNEAYLERSYLYNARHWLESVRLGRNYGTMLGDAYCEVAYEELCARPDLVGKQFMEFLGLPLDQAGLAATAQAVQTAAIGKFRRQPAWRLHRVQRLIEPTLLAFGYRCDPLPPSRLELLQRWLRHRWQGVKRRVFRA